MDAINQSILTLILLVPLAGAVLVALVPDRVKLPNWIALLTTLVSFVLTLHLPAHFVSGQGGFQFEINQPWIESPAIFYHVGVDGLSLWLVVLVGLLAPVGVVASWNAIKERRKIFYSLFLVQQTAMVGVFISLDLMLYYGFWELSLVPMAILIAMYGRKDGPKAALKFFLFTFIPSAPLLVAILWLYARTGSFDFATLQILLAHGNFPAAAMCWVALAFLFAFAVKVPRLPAAWLAGGYLQRSAGRDGHGGRRQAWPLLHAALSCRALPCPGARGRALSDRAGRHRHSLRRMPGAGAARLLEADGLCRAEPSEPDRAGHLRPHIYRLDGRGLPDSQSRRRRRCAVPAAGRARSSLRDQPDRCVWRAGGEGCRARQRFFVIASLAMIGLPMLGGFVGEFLILSSTFTEVSRGWTVAAALGVILGAAYMLWLVQRIFYGPESKLAASKPGNDLHFGELAVLCAACGADAGDGPGAFALDQFDSDRRASAAS